MIRRWALGLAVMLCFAVPALAAPLEAYGRLPSVETIQLAPDGRHMAVVTTLSDRRTLVVTSTLSKDEKPLTVGLGDQKLRELRWADSAHLLITISSTATMMDVIAPRAEWFITQLMDTATGRTKVVSSQAPKTLNIVAASPEVRTVNGRTVAIFEGIRLDHRGLLTLYKMDMVSGRAVTLEEGDQNATDWVVDQDGTAVAASSYDESRKMWTLRFRRNGKWHLGETLSAPLDPPNLVGLGRTSDTILVSRLVEGHQEFRELSLVDGLSSNPLPVDITEPVYDPNTGLLMGGKIVSDTVRYVFFDPAVQAQWDRVARPFKGATLELLSWTTDRKKMTLLVNGPGFGLGYFLVDLETLRADPLSDAYAKIGPDDIAPVRSISYKAADGLAIPAYLTLPSGRSPKNLPLIVLPHGGPAARDAPGFDWWSQALASRGYAVLQPQFRGSTGFGEAFTTAGYGQWGRKMQTDLSDGVRYLAAQGTIDPHRVCIVGASYGGYAALAGATIDKDVYRCAVSVAGPGDLTRFLAWIRARQLMSADTLRLRYWIRFLGAGGLRDPVLDDISPAKLAAKASAPILLIHGKDDTVVPFEQSQLMADALQKAGKPVQLVTLTREDHWLSRPDTRLQMLTETVRFLEANNPPN